MCYGILRLFISNPPQLQPEPSLPILSKAPMEMGLGYILFTKIHALLAIIAPSRPQPGISMIGDAPSLPNAQPQTQPGLDSGPPKGLAAERIQLITSSIATQASLRTLEVGQIVNARILEVGSQGSLKLEIEGQQLTASSPTGLQPSPGQNIQLQLISATTPPLFRVLLTSLANEQAAQAQLLRQLLPRQSGLDQLFDQLGQLLSGNQTAERLPTASPQPDTSLERTLVQLVRLIGSQQLGPTQSQALAQPLSQALQQFASQSGNSQLQQALYHIAQQLSTSQPSTNSPEAQLQQALNQIAQQLSIGQNSATHQEARVQLQQALNQIAQQLGVQTTNQSPAKSPQTSPQLQQSLGQAAQSQGTTATNQTTSVQTASLAQAAAQAAAASQASSIQQAQQTQQAKELDELLRLISGHSLDNQKQLGPETVRSLFLASGLFLEAGLAQSRTPRADDLKSLLLRMVTILQGNSHQNGVQHLIQRLISRSQNPKPEGAQQELQTQVLHQLRKATEGALAKLELQQLQSLPQKEDEARQSWHFALTLNEEAKFREVEARITREQARRQQQDSERWNVDLHFDFEASGPMDARIQLQQTQIQVNFWASRSQTLERIRTLLPRLERALAKAGLEVTQLGAWPGAQSRPKERTLAPASGLVNLRA